MRACVGTAPEGVARCSTGVVRGESWPWQRSTETRAWIRLFLHSHVYTRQTSNFLSKIAPSLHVSFFINNFIFYLFPFFLLLYQFVLCPYNLLIYSLYTLHNIFLLSLSLFLSLFFKIHFLIRVFLLFRVFFLRE